MIVTIALVVVCSSIIAFFSQEFVRMFKKLFSIPGMKLFLPLAIASCLIEVYEDWGFWFLTSFQAAIEKMTHALAHLFPFETGSVLIIRILFLFVLACIPIIAYRLRAKFKGNYAAPHPYIDLLSLILWLVAAILLTVPI